MSFRSTHTLALVCAGDVSEPSAQRALRILQTCAAEPSGNRLRVVLIAASALVVRQQRAFAVRFLAFRHDATIETVDDELAIDAVLFVDRVTSDLSPATCRVVMLNVPWLNEERRIALDANVDAAALTVRCTVVARQVVASDCHFAVASDHFDLACLCAVDAVAAAHCARRHCSISPSRRDGGVWITAVDCLPTLYDQRAFTSRCMIPTRWSRIYD
jgi:hypothetical protein